MITIVAGSRTITDYAIVKDTIEKSGFDITELVSGHAQPQMEERWQPSVDLLGERWAKENGIVVRTFPAPWTRYGKAAGAVRNGWMAEYAANYCPDGGSLIAVRKAIGKSNGTDDMIDQATTRGLAVICTVVGRSESN